MYAKAKFIKKRNSTQWAVNLYRAKSPTQQECFHSEKKKIEYSRSHILPFSVKEFQNYLHPSQQSWINYTTAKVQGIGSLRYLFLAFVQQIFPKINSNIQLAGSFTAFLLCKCVNVLSVAKIFTCAVPLGKYRFT